MMLIVPYQGARMCGPIGESFDRADLGMMIFFRIRIDGTDATNAAYEVGYESVSQFSREYSRFFGQPSDESLRR